MAQLTPAPDYRCNGGTAPEAHSFTHGEHTFHVHRFVDAHGKPAKRFANNWQFSQDGVVITKTRAYPTMDHAVRDFIKMWDFGTERRGSGWMGRELIDTLADNKKKIR